MLGLGSTLVPGEIQCSYICEQELSIEKTFQRRTEYLNNGHTTYQLCITEIHGCIELVEQNSGK